MAIAIADAVSLGTFSTPMGAITWPNGSPPNGNILVASGVCQPGGTYTIAPPSGWNTLFNANSNPLTNGQGSGLFWKVAASEPSSLTWGIAPSAAGQQLVISMLSISGAVSTTPQWVQTTTSASSLTAGPLTPAAINALVLAAFNGGNGISALSTAGGWTATTSNYDYGSGFASLIESQNALTPNTTTPISVASTATGTVGGLNGYLVIVAPFVAAGGGAVGNSDVAGGCIGNGGVAGGTIGNSLPGLP